MLNKNDIDFLYENLMFFKKLNKEQMNLITENSFVKKYKKGDMIHTAEDDCIGLILIRSGNIRAYFLSENGKEITLYRLFEKDSCILSASCMMKNITFNISMEVERDTDVVIIPLQVYNLLNSSNLNVQSFTNELVSSRFSDVMWIVEQIVFMSFDKRLAIFLMEQSAIENSNIITMTHENIAKNLGSAREVVSRMLKYFQTIGIIKVQRKSIEIIEIKKLMEIAEKQ